MSVNKTFDPLLHMDSTLNNETNPGRAGCRVGPALITSGSKNDSIGAVSSLSHMRKHTHYVPFG